MTSLLVGVTSERLVQYQFVARNLMPPKKQALLSILVLEIPHFAKVIGELGKGNGKYLESTLQNQTAS
jgi:hypothetical protein